MPVTMAKPPVPPNLFKSVCCSCKNSCETMPFSCPEHGLKCADSCKECRGISCVSCQEIDLDMFDEHD